MSRKNRGVAGRRAGVSRRAVLVLIILALIASAALLRATEPTGTSDRVDLPRGRQLDASWDFRPETLDELTYASQLVTSARVIDVTPGPSLTSPEPDEPGGVDTIPTQRIRFETQSVLANTSASPAPSTFTVFRTGSSDVSLDGDPPYDVGQSYLMFVAPRGEGDNTWLPPAPDGRLLLDATVRAEPLIDGLVGSQLAGKSLNEISQMVATAQSKGEAAAPPDRSRNKFDGSCSVSGRYTVRTTPVSPFSLNKNRESDFPGVGSCNGALNGEQRGSSAVRLALTGNDTCFLDTSSLSGTGTLTFTADEQDPDDDTDIAVTWSLARTGVTGVGGTGRLEVKGTGGGIATGTASSPGFKTFCGDESDQFTLDMNTSDGRLTGDQEDDN